MGDPMVIWPTICHGMWIEIRTRIPCTSTSPCRNELKEVRRRTVTNPESFLTGKGTLYLDFLKKCNPKKEISMAWDCADYTVTEESFLVVKTSKKTNSHQTSSGQLLDRHWTGPVLEDDFPYPFSFGIPSGNAQAGMAMAYGAWSSA